MEEEKVVIPTAQPEVATAATTPSLPSKAAAINPRDLLIPVSIVIAGIAIGAGLYLSGGGPTKMVNNVNNPGAQEPIADTTNKIDAVSEKDHYVGNLNAPVKIVEYSDFECPFCKKFHATLEAVTKKYGDQVVWIYRQFPLEQLHQKAPKVAMASECVAELGGNDAFWIFTNGYYDASLSNDRTDIETVIPQLVAKTGVNKAKFDECVASGRHQDVIDAHMADATETGGRGTPWTIIIGPDGKTSAINGALPQSAVEQAIKTALESK